MNTCNTSVLKLSKIPEKIVLIVSLILFPLAMHSQLRIQNFTGGAR